MTILLQKLDAMTFVYTGVSQMNSLISETLSQNQICIYMSHIIEVMTIFVTFLPILAKIWLPWQPLDHCNQKCFLWIGRFLSATFHEICTQDVDW